MQSRRCADFDEGFEFAGENIPEPGTREAFLPLLAQNFQIGHKSLVADLAILAVAPHERLADPALLGECRQTRELFFDQCLEEGLGMQRHEATMPKKIAVTNAKFLLASISLSEYLYR